MKMQNNYTLEGEIDRILEGISSIQPGDKDHSAAVNSLATLYKLKIEETENERAFMAKCDRELIEEREMRLKNAQLAEQVKDRYFRLGLEAAGIVLPLVFYAVWMRRGFRFEETGTFTSTTFRGLFNKFKPTKR
jgi:hypothetical protein